MPVKKNSLSNLKELLVLQYNKKNYQENLVTFSELSKLKKTKDGVTWITFPKKISADFFKKNYLGFDLHPLIIENIEGKNSKVEVFPDYIYFSISTIETNRSNEISSQKVSFIIAKKILITSQKKSTIFSKVRELLSQPNSVIRSMGSDYLAYQLLDEIINDHFLFLENFGEELENLQTEVIKNSTNHTLRDIHKLKKNLVEFRKSVWPLREVVEILERGGHEIINEQTKVYLRDLEDKLIQALEIAENYRETLTGLMEIYISVIGNKTNSIMKVLTVITTLFMPLTFLTGLYGMNFTHMPGIESENGFFLMLAIMNLVAAGMLGYFLRKKWL